MNYMPKLQEAMNYIMHGEDTKALPLMQEIIDYIETDDSYKPQDDGKKPVAFDEDFEYYLYGAKNDLDSIRWIQEPVSLVYVFDAELHMNMGDYDAAIAALEKALQWNPISAKAQLAMAEAYAAKHEEEKFHELTLAAFPNIFHSEEMGQAYRNLGYYFTSKDELMPAISSFGLSMLYEQTNEAIEGLTRLRNMHPDEKAHMPADDELEQIAKDYNIPLTPDPDIMTTLYIQVQAAKAAGDEKRAKQFLEIVYDLKQGEAFFKYEHANDQPSDDKQE